jgi:hypothetical protein
MAALVNGKCVHSKRKHQPHEWDWKTGRFLCDGNPRKESK